MALQVRPWSRASRSFGIPQLQEVRDGFGGVAAVVIVPVPSLSRVSWTCSEC
jgi:hypothetical protein